MSGNPKFLLSASDFDLLYSDLEFGSVPFPLEVPSVGATFEERERLTSQMYQDLERRGLARRGQLNEDLRALLRLLGDNDYCVDAVGYLEQPIRALAATDRRLGVLANVVADQVQLSALRPTAVAGSIVDVLPQREAGPVRAVSVPQEPLSRVLDPDDELDDPFGGDLDDEAALIRAGVPTKDATTLIDLAEARIAGGQFGVSVGSDRIQNPVTWFDTAQGRYLMVNDGSWLSISPADQGHILGRLNTILSTVEAKLVPR